ncbi:MAG TPA: 6-phosphogluconolactonase [Gemmatimonadota bacterium]
MSGTPAKTSGTGAPPAEPRPATAPPPNGPLPAAEFPAAGARALLAPDPGRAAAEVARLVAEAVAGADSRFTLVISGGRGPRPLFRMLAEEQPVPLPWERVHVFWADERCVPPDHPESNAGRARDLLLDRVTLPAGNVHRIHGEDPPERAAAAYRAELARFFRAELPAFDLVLLGLGADGHTCSLFPGSRAIESPRAAEAAVAPEGVRDRVTLTPAALRGAAAVVFLVTGGDKAPAVVRALEGEGTPSELPSRAVRPAGGEPLWVLDRDAASGLRGVRWSPRAAPGRSR